MSPTKASAASAELAAFFCLSKFLVEVAAMRFLVILLALAS